MVATSRNAPRHIQDEVQAIEERTSTGNATRYTQLKMIYSQEARQRYPTLQARRHHGA